MSSVRGRQCIGYLMEKYSLSELSWTAELRKIKYYVHLLWRRQTAPSCRRLASLGWGGLLMKKTPNFSILYFSKLKHASYDSTVQDVVLIHIPTRKALRKNRLLSAFWVYLGVAVTLWAHPIQTTAFPLFHWFAPGENLLLWNAFVKVYKEIYFIFSPQLLEQEYLET